MRAKFTTEHNGDVFNITVFSQRGALVFTRGDTFYHTYGNNVRVLTLSHEDAWSLMHRLTDGAKASKRNETGRAIGGSNFCADYSIDISDADLAFLNENSETWQAAATRFFTSVNQPEDIAIYVK